MSADRSSWAEATLTTCKTGQTSSACLPSTLEGCMLVNRCKEVRKMSCGHPGRQGQQSEHRGFHTAAAGKPQTPIVTKTRSERNALTGSQQRMFTLCIHCHQSCLLPTRLFS